jgi:hypothetical protein
MIMTKKHRIGIVLALIWFLVRVLDHNRRTGRRVHHRIASSPTDGDSLGNLADTESTAPYNLDPRNFGDTDAQASNDLLEILEGVYGEAAQTYFQRYLKLWPIYRRLKNHGVHVRISLGRFRQEPLLIINGKVHPIKL